MWFSFVGRAWVWRCQCWKATGYGRRLGAGRGGGRWRRPRLSRWPSAYSRAGAGQI